jgi:hypothetical protein
MNTLNEIFLEHDLNPFVVFNGEGKLIHYNQEAEYLLSFVSPHKLYELAVNHATQSFGIQKSHVNLRYDRYIFCALLVGYIDDDRIGLKLYKEMANASTNINQGDATKTNIYTLLQLSKNSVFANRDILVTESLDPTIPEMKLHIEKFLKLLNRIFKEYLDCQDIEIMVRLKIGQNLVVDGKSYPICNINIQNHKLKIKENNTLHSLANEANVMVIIKDGKVTIEFPIIA